MSELQIGDKLHDEEGGYTFRVAELGPYRVWLVEVGNPDNVVARDTNALHRALEQDVIEREPAEQSAAVRELERKTGRAADVFEYTGELDVD